MRDTWISGRAIGLISPLSAADSSSPADSFVMFKVKQPPLSFMPVKPASAMKKASLSL